MLNGFNTIFDDKKKLDSWTSYLEMRECVIRANEELQPGLSKDLGAISGLLFDVGVGKISLDQNWEKALQFEKEKREKEVLAQLKRPSFQTSTCIGLRYLLFSELEQHCHGLCKFGDDYRILFKLAKDASCISR